jgi:hypothetical protein
MNSMDSNSTRIGSGVLSVRYLAHRVAPNTRLPLNQTTLVSGSLWVSSEEGDT